MKKVYVDSMMGEVVKWLRLFGFYTEYVVSNLKDREIIKALEMQKNILFVTSDKQLAETCERKGIPTILIGNNKHLVDKLVIILRTLGVNTVNISESRCVYCNSKLIRIKNEIEFNKIIKESITKTKYRRNAEPYFYCKHCKKVYWRGRMWKNIEKIVEEINRRLKNVEG